MWNPDDPVRHVGVRNEMAKADSETQRDAAKLAGQVQHDPCMSAAAGVCTLALESAGISGPQPWNRRSSDGTKMQNCARGDRRDARVNDPWHCARPNGNYATREAILANDNSRFSQSCP